MIKYYKNDQLKIKCNYKDGKLDGEYTSYYNNGKTQSHCYYENGNIIGFYAAYKKDGDLDYKHSFHN